MRDILHQVEDVVHPGDQLMDFVAIERSDERLMKQRDGLPRDLIRLFFVALDVSAPRLEIGDVLEQSL